MNHATMNEPTRRVAEGLGLSWRKSLRRLATWLLMPLLLVACGGGGGGATSDPPPPSAGFSIEVSPPLAVAFADSGRVLTVTLTRTGGFTADVTVALSNPPAGVTAEAVTFTGGAASLSLPVRLASSVPPGTLALAFDASSGNSHVGATEQLSVQAAQARAQQMIAEALAANRIDRDTSLLYRLYALAGDPRLPDEFVGSGGDEEDLRLFAEVEAALPQMSAAMQAAIHPFMVRPDHPDSIYRRPGTTSARSSALGARLVQASRVPPASDCVAGAQWRSVRSATIPVRVWSECYDEPANNALATLQGAKAMQVFENIWAPMTALMGPPILDGERMFDKDGNDVTDNGGDDAIDVYIVNSYSLTRANRPINTAALGTFLGMARPADPIRRNAAGEKKKSSGYFLLPAVHAVTPFQRSTITHEFFHVLQFAHNTGLFGGWFYEASARWSESHFDRVLEWPERVALEKVHKYWFNVFLNSDVALDWPKDEHPYASYIWPFFLEQETGGPGIIGQIWTALEAAAGPADEDRIIDAAYGFDTNFHRFAVRNVNEKLEPGHPLKKLYVDLAGEDKNKVKQFPDATTRQLVDGTLVSEFQPEYVNRPLVTGTEDTSDWKVKPLSAKYARFKIDRAAPPSRVEFDFTGLSGRTGLKLDALILATAPSGADEWVSEPVPLEFDGKAVFCFQAGPSTTTVRGAFTTLRLVLSNGSLNETVTGNIVVRPTNKPCGTQWQGTIEYTQDAAETHLGGNSQSTTTITTQLAFELDPNAVDLRTVFRLRSGSFVYRQVGDSVDVGNNCHRVTTAAGPLHPQLALADNSDGAAAGTLYTYVGAFGTPQYQLNNELGSNAVYGYARETTNSHCTRGDTSESSSGFLMQLWQTAGFPGDITEGGTVMQGTYSFPTGQGTISYKWLLTKKSE